MLSRGVAFCLGDPMKDEYDFSTAERGRFFRKGARLVASVHLEPDVLDHLSELATVRGVSLNELVNTLLKEDIERIDAAKWLVACRGGGSWVQQARARPGKAS
jgi:hypothetical protein